MKSVTRPVMVDIWKDRNFFRLELCLSVFVLDQRGLALMPCSEKKARLLLERGRARVHRMVPFVIRLIDRKVEDSELQSVRLKLDPGSKTTGVALVRDVGGDVVVLSLAELVHRGRQISEALTARRSMRRRRRGANLRHRAPRFLNRGNKKSGWLAPSLQHRVDTTVSLVNRWSKWVPVGAISMELVRFDMQLIANPEISGVEYQQGTIAGYELRQYMLEKWGRACAYCGKEGVPLQMEHIKAKSKGGSNAASNICVACESCNTKKGTGDVSEFLKNDPVRLKRILAQAKAPLKDAAAVNSTRWALFTALKATELAVETGSGGLTKFNRTRLGIPKAHSLDAACVGIVGEVRCWNKPVLSMKCSGRGSYQRTRLNKYGFPRGFLMRQKSVHGFQTGDMVKAVVPSGKKAGVHIGRVAIRESGYFNIQTGTEVIQGISHKHCKVTQRSDGYGYSLNKVALTTKGSEIQRRSSNAALPLPDLKDGVSRAS